MAKLLLEVKSMQTLRLLKMDIMSLWHRLKYDWGSELTALTCFVTLLSLFFYLFGDFLNEKILVLPENTRIGLLRWSGRFIWSILGVQLGASLRVFRGGRDLAKFSIALGEKPKVVRRFEILMAALTALFSIFVIVLILKWVLKLPAWYSFLNMLFGLGTFLPVFFLPTGRLAEKTFKYWSPQSSKVSRSMWSFRHMQMVGRNRICQMVLCLAFALAGCHIWLADISAPFVLHGSLAILVGVLSAIPLPLQLREDLSYAWAERLMGTSHKSVVSTYYLLALECSTPTIMMTLIGYLTFAKGSNFQLFSVICLTLMGPVLTPSLMFQLEPRKPSLTILALFIICVFVGTAILAHPLAIALLPVVIHYASSYQIDRYYRA